VYEAYCPIEAKAEVMSRESHPSERARLIAPLVVSLQRP
jgi:hypothetical protein